jgi:hypothetical protein
MKKTFQSHKQLRPSGGRWRAPEHRQAAALFFVAAVIGAAAVSPRAATFNSDFNSGVPNGVTLQGDPEVTKIVDTGGVNNSPFVQLTDDQGNRSGAMVIADFNNAEPIGGFTLTAKVLVGGGSARPADGISFVWADDIPDGAWSEEGAGTGLTIAVDTYDNSGADTAPAIEVKFGGTGDADVIATAFLEGVREGNRPRPNYGAVTLDAAGNPMAPQTGTNWATFKVDMHPDGKLDVVWKDVVVFTNLTIPNFEPQLARFGFGARTGGATEFHWIDDLNITTVPAVPDTTRPAIAKVEPGRDLRTVTVTFTKALSQATAEEVSNYRLSGDLTISSATLVRPWVVVLNTSAQTAGTSYTLTVNNVEDLAATPNTIQANSTAPFSAFLASPGFLTVQYYNNVTGTLVSDLMASAAFPAGFDDTRYVGEFASLSGYGDNYGARVFGFLVPETTGDYTFFIRSDDASQLFLSSNETAPDPLADTPIAEETDCCDPYQEPDTTNDDGFTSAASQAVRLVAGNRYAVLALLKEGTGGDYVQVAWRLSTDTTPAAELAPIPSRYLLTYAPGGGTVAISQQPAAVTEVAGKTGTFTVQATGSPPALAYQWLRNGAEIPGATAATYTTPFLVTTDSGAKYSVRVSVPGSTVTSSEALLTVSGDTIPPQIEVGAVKNGSNYDVGVQFDEVVDAASASVQANYSISSGSITGFKYWTNSPGAVLTVSGLVEGNKYTVTVKDVADLQGNKITTASKEFTASKMAWGVVGANELQRGNGVLAVGANGFDIYSDGMTEWATYDEATFVYEEVTGDFDKRLRVEYQDASSQWARAGLIVREVTNFGVDRATQEGGEAGRYQKVHVNPVGPTLTGPGNLGNAAWEGNRRLATGVATTTAGGGGVPAYPNAWCRLQRTGDLFTIYRSDDGVNWTQLGTTTFDEPMPATLFVGPEFSPENGNITDENSRGVFVAKIRDYGNFDPNATEPTLAFSRAGATLTLTFQGGVLQSATRIGAGADWQNVAGATSPFAVTVTSAPVQFFRVISP